MDNNDFDIDKLFEDNDAFKPLTKGLGFHHSLKTEEEIGINLKRSSEILRNDLDSRAKSLNTTIQTERSLDRGDLSAFYSIQEKVEEVEELPLEKEKVMISKSLLTSVRLMAFAIDFSIVVLMFAFTLAMITLSYSFQMNLLTNKDFLLELVKQTSLLFVFFYLFYFSFLDKTNYSTVGKRIFSLKVETFSHKQITMFQAFLRSFLTLVSFASLGLFSLLDFQGKMTETVVVKSE